VFSDNAMTLLESRYLLPGETVEMLFDRVASFLSDNEKHKKELYECMYNLEFLPNSPTLMNAGTDLGQLSACFVLPVEDSIDSIFEAVKLAALVHKTGGGTGFDFSNLRPAGSMVKSTSGVASGPVSFMKVFDAATGAIKQGGKRRGANMGILRIDHPDIENFLSCKKQEGELSNFNISVALTNEFVDRVMTDNDFDLVDDKGNVVKTVRARDLFDKIVEGAWENGEPGVVFIDTINRYNPTPELGMITATNPCGEQPLLPYESCNLGSINLSKFVKDGKIDWLKLKKVVRIATRALDNVIDKNKYISSDIENRTKETRKIGLGVMGFADMLLKLGVKYDSLEATHVARRVMRIINVVSKLESIELAKEKGAFPAFEKSIYAEGRLPTKWPHTGLSKRIQKHGIRNATTTTIAPTGSLSFIAGCSSGIEPIFSYFQVRKVLDGEYLEVNQVLKEVAGDLTEEVDPKQFGDYFVSVKDIEPKWHVMMQGTFQEFTDNAVSKTINLPNEASKEDVEKAILLAYHLKCKGLTLYRDGSRMQQVLYSKNQQESVMANTITPRERPKELEGTTTKIRLGCNRNIYVTLNRDEYGPCEVFLTTGKSGGCIASYSEALARMISLALRSGIEVSEIIDQLKGIRCPAPAWYEQQILSCSDAVAKALEKLTENHVSTENGISPECPRCGAILEFKEGCATCPSCGFSQCG